MEIFSERIFFLGGCCSAAPRGGKGTVGLLSSPYNTDHFTPLLIHTNDINAYFKTLRDLWRTKSQVNTDFQFEC